MAYLQPYVFFEGSCEDALHFYKEALNGEISDLQRFGKVMKGDVMKDRANHIMHAKFTFWGGEFFASDTISTEPEDWKDQNIHICVTCDTIEQGRETHQKLSVGGQIISPYQKEFWGDHFGALIDKYNIRWMVAANEA